ncbi:MAG: sigma-54-dependent Fis family transcriptional regulator [Phycisphaerae bacterium]|nr:sigma-54-dependent Fis family transcriptional regulator [Phycisphaerae bacterium]
MRPVIRKPGNVVRPEDVDGVASFTSVVKARDNSYPHDPPGRTHRVLVVDEDAIVLSALERMLRDSGYGVASVARLSEALHALEKLEFDLILADLRVETEDGCQVLQTWRQRWPGTGVILIPRYGSIEAAVKAVRLGALDYLPKPLRAEHLRGVVLTALQQREHARRARSLTRPYDQPCTLQSVIGSTHQMQRVFDLIEAVAESTATVLIHGETGTGKSLIARVIHSLSSRRDGPFVEVSCGAIPETLLASELFGHTRGAFTGAVADKDGKFRAAEGGTILLDEISCAPPSLQMKLLRVLQERQFEPLGSNRTLTADVRVILATNVSLQKEVEAGRFRADLFYRINVVNIELPPLRERLGDIPLLATHFLDHYAAKSHKRLTGFSDEALATMQRYYWPGNVRELANCIERAVVLTRHEQVLKSDLPPALVQAVDGDTPLHLAAGFTGSAMTLKEALAEPERRILLAALRANNWNRIQTAEMLNINRTTLYKKMKRYRLDEAEPQRREA